MNDDFEKKIKEIGDKHQNLRVESADLQDGTLSMRVAVTGGPEMPPLPPGVEVLSAELGGSDTIGSVSPIYEAANLRTINIDPLLRSDLDNAKPSVLRSSPHELFQRSIDYYQSKDVYGTAINVLTNFASKGFENDIDDVTIKNFFDNWVIDTGFDDIVEKIFFDFFRVSMVRTYKIRGQYEPKVSYISSTPGKKPARVRASVERAVRNNRYTDMFIPIAYTILNPTLVEIKGSLMFGQTAIYLKAKAGEEIKKMLEMPSTQLSTFQKKIIESMPVAFKKAVLEGQDIPLDPDLVGEVDYRRQPYERYPIPRGARAFESLEFKNELRKADYSTLDGITNYILKITVGNDNHPVTKQEILERVGEMFDTVSKSFKVVWNHTLNVEKITSPEVGEILGPDKYKQVNGDITGAMGMVRGLIDGEGNGSGAAVELAVKSIIEEINYARRQVTRWIYSEYKTVAEVMKFDRYPRVRFDDMALRDEIQMMAILEGLADRRIVSYNTIQKKLGFDPDTELAQMKVEKPLVLDGTLGLVGSPFQQTKQPVQGTPRGTPSEGRPRGRPAVKPKPKDKTVPRKAAAELDELFQDFDIDEIEKLLREIRASKRKKRK